MNSDSGAGARVCQAVARRIRAIAPRIPARAKGLQPPVQELPGHATDPTARPGAAAGALAVSRIDAPPAPADTGAARAAAQGATT
ncbi:hypothetical protein [Streptomyces sp. GESEQ-4]|uniref:hypothetical protein n=1 Tax=Streptomyces sp. GESEQ-4 TaxID=2812655 RepID=UPI001B3427EE|nr:hypothetical protein [Streptomyces sp. GESEQ-4]